MNGVFGMDLGTTNSCITVRTNKGIPTVLKLDDGLVTKSVVSICSKTGEYLIGKQALTQDAYQRSFKKYMGTNKELYIRDKVFTAKELSHILVKNMLTQVRTLYPEYNDITDIVVSHPAYFSTAQVKDTKDAFNNLGDLNINVTALHSEPLAAAMVYQESYEINNPIVVFDLGGGTFDVVLLKSETPLNDLTLDLYNKLDLPLKQAKRVLDIQNTEGNNSLGGDDIDLFNAKKIAEELGIEPNDDLIRICQQVKDTGDSLVYRGRNIDSIDVEFGVMQVYAKCEELLTKVVGYNKNVTIVLCGGSTKSELLRYKLKEKYSDVRTAIDPDLSVAIGCAMLGSYEYLSELTLVQRAPMNIGIKHQNGFEPIIRKGDVYPTKRTKSFANTVPFEHSKHMVLGQSGDSFTVKPVCIIYLNELETLEDAFDKDGQAIYDITFIYNKSSFLTVQLTTKGHKLEIPVMNVEMLETTLDDNRYVLMIREFILKNDLSSSKVNLLEDAIAKFKNENINERDLFKVFNEVRRS